MFVPPRWQRVPGLPVNPFWRVKNLIRQTLLQNEALGDVGLHFRLLPSPGAASRKTFAAFPTLGRRWKVSIVQRTAFTCCLYRWKGEKKIVKEYSDLSFFFSFSFVSRCLEHGFLSVKLFTIRSLVGATRRSKVEKVEKNLMKRFFFFF